jgi:glycosyltransferase involved in cell wall biosynthesis
LERFRPMAREACRAHLNWEPGCFHVLFPANAGDAVKRPALARAAVDELHRMGIRVVLHRLEHVRYADVPLWLNASDVVLLTSHHEGSPNIIKEALACNRPVVSVDVGDVRERIEGITGCFLAEADPAELAARLRRVHDGPRVVAARDQMTNLSLSSVGRQLKQFYETFHGPSLNSRRTRTAAETSPSTLNGVVPIEN